MCFSSPSNTLQQQQLDMQTQQEAQRQANLVQGMNDIDSTFGAYDQSGVYDTIKNSYLDYAQPQVQEQYEQAKKDLTYQLARQGLSSSTAAADLDSKLSLQAGRAEQQVVSAADDAAATAKQNAATAKNNAVSALTASNDPAAAKSVLSSNLSAISNLPSYGSLGTLVSGVTGALASGVNGATNGQGLLGSTGAAGTQLYGSSSKSGSSGKTVSG